MGRNIFFCVVLLSILSSQLAHADGTVDLGPVDRVTALFSYPDCQSNCTTTTPTLEETVTHYFTQSLQRDGFADSTVSVTKSAGHVVARFVGSAAVVYPNQVTGVLQAGDAGLKAVKQLQADNKWRNDWRFFLPLGLAWVKHPTLEILHFPPDYTLNSDQDYLAAKTTQRWSDLLVSQGLTPELSGRYQGILDIAPIAALGNAGPPGCAFVSICTPLAALGVYSYFHDYHFQLLQLWLSATEPKVPRPAVAFGSNVALPWVKQNFNIDLEVGEIGSMAVPNIGNVQVIGANHPAYLGYVITRKGQTDKQRFDMGMKVMQQDAIVACWQIIMGKAPDGDPGAVLSSCRSNWMGRTEDICRLLEKAYITASLHPPDCGSGVLKNFVYPSDEQAAEMAKLSVYLFPNCKCLDQTNIK
jgi:hypothetical protein